MIINSIESGNLKSISTTCSYLAQHIHNYEILLSLTNLILNNRLLIYESYLTTYKILNN